MKNIRWLKIENYVSKSWNSKTLNNHKNREQSKKELAKEPNKPYKINLKTKLNKNKLLNFFQIMFNKFQRIITFISKNRDNLLLHFTNVQIEAKACLGLLKNEKTNSYQYKVNRYFNLHFATYISSFLRLAKELKEFFNYLFFQNFINLSKR